ncbi:MAG: 50S ribosomal protein L6 [Chrysiogenales bacterium]|nr:MAG: 50S ribosomal protein L6 [Chrysiogenales bacterium]
MSRVAKKPIQIPAGVTADYSDRVITITGPRGTQKQPIMQGVEIEIDNGEIRIVGKISSEDKKAAAAAGLIRALVANMVIGVLTGFEKQMEIVVVGYRAIQQNKDVQFQIGFSHPVVFSPPEGVTVEVLEATKFKVSGADKQQVGQVAANIRKLRPPEPYKGKGIRYKDETVRKKAGKTGK